LTFRHLQKNSAGKQGTKRNTGGQVETSFSFFFRFWQNKFKEKYQRK
jgi:hypothetical protein